MDKTAAQQSDLAQQHQTFSELLDQGDQVQERTLTKLQDLAASQQRVSGRVQRLSAANKKICSQVAALHGRVGGLEND